MNEQQYLYEWELQVMKRFSTLLQELGVLRRKAPWRDGKNPNLPHLWFLFYDRKDHRKDTGIRFENIDYVGSEVEYGEPSVSSTFIPDGSWRREQDAREGAIEEEVEKEVEYVKEEETSYNAEATWNVTHRTSAKASGGVEGIAEAEASVENEVSAGGSFGFRNGKRTFQRNREVVRSKLVTPEGMHRVWTCDKKRTREVTPFTERGLIDCSLFWNLYDWSSNFSPYLKLRVKGRHSHQFRHESWEDMLAFFRGERVVEFPGMRDFLKKCSPGARQAFEWLADPKNRMTPALTGQRVLTYDSDASFRPRQLWPPKDR